MRFFLFLIAPLCFAQLAITGSATHNQGDTETYVVSGGTPSYTCSMITGSVGSVTSGCAYTAPASVTAKNPGNGCQVFPNNSVFNTPISALSVHASNSTWMAALVAGSMTTILVETDFPLNYGLSTDTAYPMTFYYMEPVADYVIGIDPKTENGLYPLTIGDTYDHHVNTLIKDTCESQELYNIYKRDFSAGFSNICPLCTATSGAKHDLTSFTASAYGTDAVGMSEYGLSLKVSEWISGAINHALRITLCTGCFDPSRHIWPAQADIGGTPDTGKAPYGVRMRLKSGYSMSFDGLCATMTCQTYVNTFLTALKTYGAFVADAGSNGAVSMTYDAPMDSDLSVGGGGIPNAITEIYANLALNGTNFEFVDESGLQTSPTGSGTDNLWHEAYYNNGVVTPDSFSIIQAMDSMGMTVTKSIALQGTAIGVPKSTEVFLAGAPAYQLQAWVNGINNKTLTYAISPSGGDYGTVTSGGLYTPASSVSGRTATIATVTASDGTTKTFNIIIFPNTLGTAVSFDAGATTPYTDTNGHLWNASFTSNVPLWELDDRADLSGHSWSGTVGMASPNIFNYINALADIPYGLHVPNGNYTVDLNFGNFDAAADGHSLIVELNGSTVDSEFDPFIESGSVQYGTFVKSHNVTISNGQLNMVIRHTGVTPYTDPCCNGNLYHVGGSAYLAGFSVTQTSNPSSTFSRSISGIRRISGTRYIH